MIIRFLRKLSLISALALWSTLSVAAPTSDSAANSLSILHALDYLAVDYAQVVIHGEIINASEYAEQQEFSAQAQNLISKLPDNPRKAQMERDAEHLVSLIEQRASGQEVQTLCRNLSDSIIDAYQVSISPPTAPSPQSAATLYADKCAQCHGATGYGDGPLAATLSHKPINFHDRSRQGQRSVYSLYSTITLGITDTPMQPSGKGRPGCAKAVGHCPAQAGLKRGCL
jgi:high-affinity iron transporter